MRGGSGLAARLYLTLRCGRARLAVSTRSGDDPRFIDTWTKEIVAQRVANGLLPTIQSGGCRLGLR